VIKLCGSLCKKTNYKLQHMPKILAIDDNSDNLISLKAIIDDAFPGSAVFTALNGPKGIELAIANNPDVILLDIIMPGMDGFEVCRLLKLDEPVSDIPVVFLTALKGDKENRIRALEVGAEGFLSKPIDETELTVQIRAMVKIKAANEQKRDEKERLEKLVEERTKELIQSQAQLKGIFENLQDAYFQTNLSGCFTIVSPSSVKMYGYQSADELIGLSADKLYFDLNERYSMLSVLRSAGSIKDYVLRGRKKDGSAFWVSMNVQLLKGSDGQILGTEGVVRDISERKKTEDELKESEERFRHISSSISDISYSCVNDPEGNSTINWLYGATEKITGYTIDELFAMKCWGKLVTDEDFPIFKSHVLEVLPGKSETCQLRLKRKDGNVVWIQATAECVKGLEGTDFKLLYGGIVDITKRKQDEELLRESEEKYRLMVDLLPEAVIIHESGKFVFANATALKTVGADSFEQLIERPLMEYVHSDYRTISLNRIKEIYSTGRPSKFSEEKFLTLKGEIIDVEVLGLPILYMGKPAIQTIIRDITERKKTELALQKSEAQFREFFEKAADAIFIAEIESGMIVDANAAASLLMLHSHDELVGIHQSRLHPPVKDNYSKETFKKHKELIKQKLLSYALENSVVRADGIEVPVEILASEVDYQGKHCMMGTFRDITERKRASEALKNSLSLTEATLESIHNGILVVDHEGMVIKTSSRFAEMWRIPESIIASGDDEILMKSILNQLADPDEFVTKVMELYAKPKAESIDLIDFKDGRVFERISKPINMEGKAMGRVWSFLDITDRKLAENELHENIARLELAMSTANMSWWEMDMTTGQVVFERRKAEMLGYSPEKFKHYSDFMALVHPEDQEHTMDAMRAHLSGSMDKYEVEYRIKTISGEYQWYYDIGSVTKRDAEGRPLIVSGLVLNISERKGAEEELQKSHNMLEKLAAQVPGVIYQYRLYPDGRSAFPFSSPGMFDIYEVTPDEVREDASPVFTRIHPDDYDYIVETITESARNQTIYHSEFRVILPKQGLRWRMSDAKPELLEDGSTLWHGIITDITDRKKSEEALSEREQLFKGLFNASPDAIVLIDPHHPTILWPIVDCNEASCRMNGYSREEMIGKSIDLLNITPEKLEDRITYYSELKQNGIIHMETSHRHKDGHIFPIEISTSIVVIGGHEMVLGIDRDITERKQAEAELREINQRFSELVASTDGIVWEADVETFTFSFVSKNAERILGYDTEDWLQPKFWATHIFEGDRNETVQFCVDQTNLCNDHDFEYRFVAKDGRIVWLADYVKVIVENGKPKWLHGLMVDVTERKRAEMALQESEDRYRQFVSQVSEGVYRFECDQPIDISLSLEEQVDLIYDHMIIAECNNAFLKMYGIKNSNEMIGKSHLDLHGGQRHAVNRETLREFVRSGYHIENVITEEKRNDGQHLVISNSSLGIVKNNQLVRMWGTQTDITEKVKADHVQQMLYSISTATLSSGDLPELIEFISIELGKLLDSNNFFIAFYDEKTNMLSTIYEKDEKDVLNTWSAEKSATGYVVKNQKSLLLHEPEVKKLIESGEIEIYGTQSKVWLGVPLFAENKAVGAIVVQSYDNPEAYTEKDKLMLEFVSHQISISIERKKAEQQLNTALTKAQESDRLKSAFLANMSHEIRTPLNSIIGFSELMADPDFDADQQTEFAKIIINSGNSLLSIISDIMDFSKIEAGQVIVRKSPFVVQNLIFSLQNEYSFTARGKGIELRIDPLNPKDDIWIRSDENRLKQVLVNLVGNAIKFTKEGYVEIGIKATGDCIQFQVRDTGIGIPKEYHDEIFERFRQVESSNSRKYGGNGLGLAISKSLVEMMGGEIWIESVQGKGSTFYFTIPIGLTTI